MQLPETGSVSKTTVQCVVSLLILGMLAPKLMVLLMESCSTARYPTREIVSLRYLCPQHSFAEPDVQVDLWTRVRDSNIVFKTLVDRFIRTRDQQLQLVINSFIGAQASIQTAHSPSGNLDDGKGLAEPRFLPNITADPTNYGRPKHDGPALRAIALVTYGRWLFENGYQDAARNIVWPIVRNDLNYIAVHYLDAGLNLWSSLTINTRVLSAFTTAAHHRALFEGAMFAKSIDEDYEEFISEASQVLCVLQNYWKLGLSTDPEHPFIVADVINITTIANHNGRDASTLLSAISNFDPEVGCNDETFQPCSQPMLRNHKEVVDQFRGWEINTGIEAGKAVAIGRFAEDTNGTPPPRHSSRPSR
jgi:glucoamylase